MSEIRRNSETYGVISEAHRPRIESPMPTPAVRQNRASSLSRVISSQPDVHPEAVRKAVTPQMRRKSCVPSLSIYNVEPRMIHDSLLSLHERTIPSAFCEVVPSQSSALPAQSSAMPAQSSAMPAPTPARRRMSVQAMHVAPAVPGKTRRSNSHSGPSVRFEQDEELRGSPKRVIVDTEYSRVADNTSCGIENQAYGVRRRTVSEGYCQETTTNGEQQILECQNAGEKNVRSHYEGETTFYEQERTTGNGFRNRPDQLENHRDSSPPDSGTKIKCCYFSHSRVHNLSIYKLTVYQHKT